AASANYDKALALKGSIYKRSGRAAEAAEVYSELLSSSPGHPEALWNLGLLELSRKRLGPALELLEQAARVRKSAEAWEFLRNIASREKSLQGRRVEFSRAALRFRSSSDNYFQCAVALIESGDRKGCLELLREGIRRHPADSRLKGFYSQAQGAPGGGG
ncbi:MAG: tetratricopeptide repeat protein, partial [Planctomycetes bacterium]|nr:tetratricopeptide repeat protein [Planctomycetota bacterium]